MDEDQVDSFKELQDKLGFSTTGQDAIREKISKEIELEIKANEEKKRKALERKKEILEKKKKKSKSKDEKELESKKPKSLNRYGDSELVIFSESEEDEVIEKIIIEQSPQPVPLISDLNPTEMVLNEVIETDESGGSYSEPEKRSDGSDYIPSEEEEEADQSYEIKFINNNLEELTSEEDCSTNKSNKFKHSKDLEEQIEDDLNIERYKARVKLWADLRSNQRAKPVKNELFASHPIYPDHELNLGMKVPGEIYKDLFNYQKLGLQWFCKLFQNFQGGILADEMGLGKTVQMIAFLATLYYNKKLRKPSIIVAPATLTQQWVQELHRWWPALRVINLHALKLSNPADLGQFDGKQFFSDNRCINSSRSLKSVHMAEIIEPHFSSSTIFITSYEGALSYGAKFAKKDWGCVILDEGHKISNPDTKISKFCKLFKTHYRYILSGTPIQNKLRELWSIYDFIRPGLLGTRVEFENSISKSIELNGSSGNDVVQSQLAVASAETLREKIKDNLMRRIKADVALELPKKHEKAVLCKITQLQFQQYCGYIESMEVRKKTNSMADIVNLRKISNHPDIHLEKFGNTIDKYGHYSKAGKTKVLHGLLQLWHNQGHRVLIFTQGVKIQKIIAQMPFFKGKRILTMSGSTQVKERLQLVEEFNNNSQVFAFLLTTRTGGQGLNLTGANKVVIFDPDWNPSADLQALSRVWRIGQSKEVEILRLLAKGTLEERVHHLQLYKQILADRVLSNPNQKTMFRNHWTEIFSLPSVEDVLESDFNTNGYSVEEQVPTNDNLHTKNDLAILTLNSKNEEFTNQMLGLIGVGNVSASRLDTQPKTAVNPILQKVVERRFKKLELSSIKAKQLLESKANDKNRKSALPLTNPNGKGNPLQRTTLPQHVDLGPLAFKPRPGMRMDNTGRVVSKPELRTYNNTNRIPNSSMQMFNSKPIVMGSTVRAIPKPELRMPSNINRIPNSSMQMFNSKPIAIGTTGRVMAKPELRIPSSTNRIPNPSMQMTNPKPPTAPPQSTQTQPSYPPRSAFFTKLKLRTSNLNDSKQLDKKL